ncbi:MAG: helix-turn-helix transcriptional regulator [Lachnospiraceae bacterium]|nr:helix-turn-helix transcriptional regulator [Lachnospiraceae bacterium]
MISDSKSTTVFSLSMLHQVINYIEKNLLAELTPALIASHFFISESTLSSLFKVVCEMTIMEYIRNRRLTLAAEELTHSNTPIIELAYKYGYETPEAFTKAFSRFHGFPPSFVRRGFTVTKFFLPLQIEVTIQGGWNTTNLTKLNCVGQEQSKPMAYNTPINNIGGNLMEQTNTTYQIDTCTMQYKHEWSILYSLADSLIQNQIPFKVDGKTMIFAHGLEIPLDKICLTFKWNDEETVKTFFQFADTVKHTKDGFKFFDIQYQAMKVRCMFYGNCPGDDTDEFLYKNTDIVHIDNLPVPVQSLEFYYNNAEKDTEYYKMVEKRLGKHERL